MSGIFRSKPHVYFRAIEYDEETEEYRISTLQAQPKYTGFDVRTVSVGTEPDIFPPGLRIRNILPRVITLHSHVLLNNFVQENDI